MKTLILISCFMLLRWNYNGTRCVPMGQFWPELLNVA